MHYERYDKYGLKVAAVRHTCHTVEEHDGLRPTYTRVNTPRLEKAHRDRLGKRTVHGPRIQILKQRPPQTYIAYCLEYMLIPSTAVPGYDYTCCFERPRGPYNIQQLVCGILRFKQSNGHDGRVVLVLHFQGPFRRSPFISHCL